VKVYKFDFSGFVAPVTVLAENLDEAAEKAVTHMRDSSYGPKDVTFQETLTAVAVFRLSEGGG